LPVEINTINCGATGGDLTSNFNAIGAGSPFCSYFVNNSAGTNIVYDGLTKTLSAVAAVVPCTTYHLKLAIADASDNILNSGVFIQAASLTSKTIAIPGAAICSGSSATLTATGGDSYSWTPSDGLSCTDCASPSASPSTTTTYTVTITYPGGCGSTTSTTTVTVNPLPTVAVASVHNVSCFGGSDGSITVTPGAGTPGYGFTWSPSGSGNPATGLTAGSYSVTVTDANGCTAATSTTVSQPTSLPSGTISVSPNPTVAGQTPLTIFVGYGPQAVTLTETPSGGTPGYSVAWSPGSASGTTRVVSPTATTTYVATITDANGCVATNTQTINVVDIRCCAGAS